MENESESNHRWIVEESTLECQKPWGPLEGVHELAEISFNATTNLYGGEECRYEVAGELFDRRVLDFLIFEFLPCFLETLGLLWTNNARMPSEVPGCRLDECVDQDAEQRGIFGDGEEDQLVDHDRNEEE
jgi:hypothetical protein